MSLKKILLLLALSILSVILFVYFVSWLTTEDKMINKTNTVKTEKVEEENSKKETGERKEVEKNSRIDWFGSTLLVVSIIFSFFIFVVGVYMLTGGNAWFTYVKQNTIKIVMAGGNFVRYLPNIRGFDIDMSDGLIKPIDQIDPSNRRKVSALSKWITEKTGLYWAGIWPFRTILEFKILKERLIKNYSRIDNISEKIEIEGEVPVSELYWKITRPFILLDVDIQGGFRVDILVFGIFTVEDPHIPVFDLRGRFFEPLQSMVSAFILKDLGIINWADFQKLKDLRAEELNGQKSEFNIRKKIGLKCDSLVIQEYSISAKDKPLQDAIQAKEINIRKADALIEKGKGEKAYNISLSEGEKQKRILEGEGEAEAIKAKAKARAKRYEELINVFTSQGIDKRVATEMAEKQIANEIKYENISKMTGTYVEGNPSTPVNVVIPPGGKK